MFFFFLANDCTMYASAACVCFYGRLTAFRSLLRGCLQLITSHRFVWLNFAGRRICFIITLFRFSRFYVQKLSLRHLSMTHVLIINLHLCLSCKIQLTIYRSLFAYEKSDSVQKATFPGIFVSLFNFLLYPVKRLQWNVKKKTSVTKFIIWNS